MAENEEKVPAVVYALGFVAGAISSYALVSYAVAPEWLPPAFPGVAACVGGLAGFFTVEEQESIFRALVWLLAYAGFAWIILWIVFALLRVLPFDDFFDSFSAITFFVTMTVFVLVGRFAGALVFNLWKAFVR